MSKSINVITKDYKALIVGYNNTHELLGSSFVKDPKGNSIPVNNTKDFVHFFKDAPVEEDYVVNTEYQFIVRGYHCYPINSYKKDINEVHFDEILQAHTLGRGVYHEDRLVKIKDVNDKAYMFDLPSDARVYTIQSIDDVIELYDYYKGNFENIYNDLDAVFVSEQYEGYEDILIVFDKASMPSKTYNLNPLNCSMFEGMEAYKDYYVANPKKFKRVSFRMFKFNINANMLKWNKEAFINSDGKKIGAYEFTPEVLNKLNKCEVSISRNRLFETYCKPEDTADNNKFMVAGFAPMYPAVLTEKRIKAVQKDIELIMIHGIYFLGKLWKVLNQSSSQSKRGNYIWTFEDYKGEIDYINRDMSYGAIDTMIKKGETVAKINKRITLCMSSAVKGGKNYTFSFVDEPTYTALRSVYKYSYKTGIVKVEDAYVTSTPTDGSMCMSFPASFRINYETFGTISKKQYKKLVASYTPIKSKENMAKYKDLIQNDPVLSKIWNKLIFSWQKRGAGQKGLVVTFPVEMYGFDTDFVIPKGANKFKPQTMAYEDIEVEVAAINKKKKGIAYTNYQFLMGLNLSNDKIIALAKEALEKVQDIKGILTNPLQATKFLGLVLNIKDSTEDEKEVLVSKLTKAIMANPRTLNDIYIKNKLMQLIKKYIADIGFGKIAIEGDFCYVLTDLRFLFGDIENALKEGEYYYNGTEDIFLIQRAPLIDISESVKITTVDDDFYWYLKDIVIFNHYDDTLARLAGADTDGDKVLITNNYLLLSSVYEGFPCIIDTKDEFEAEVKDINNHEAYSEKNRIKTFVKFSLKDDTGKVTLKGTVIRDLMLHNLADNSKANVELLRNKLIMVRYHQGWIIDGYATLLDIKIPKVLDSDTMPQWLIEWNAYKVDHNRYLNDYKKYREEFMIRHGIRGKYDSLSFMGTLFNFISQYRANLKTSFTDIDDFSFEFQSMVDPDDLKAFLPAARRIREQYNKAINDVLKADYSDYDYQEANDERSDRIGKVVEDYSDYFARIIPDRKFRAMLAYIASYSDERFTNSERGKSFVWNCCFDGMIELMLDMKEGYKLVRIPEKFKDSALVEIKNNAIFFDGKCYSKVGNAMVNGIYDIYEVNDECFIKMPVSYKDFNITPEGSLGIATFKITLKGFHFRGFNAKDVMEAIRRCNGEFSLVSSNNMLHVVVEGKPMAVVDAEDVEAFGMFIENQRMQLKEDISDYALIRYYDKTMPPEVYIIDKVKKEAYTSVFTIEAYPVEETTEVVEESVSSVTQMQFVEEEKRNENTVEASIVSVQATVTEIVEDEFTSPLLQEIKDLPKFTTSKTLLIDISDYTAHPTIDLYNEIRTVIGFKYNNVLFYNKGFELVAVYGMAGFKGNAKYQDFETLKAYVKERM